MIKPKCRNPKCENDGWVNVNGEYFCGECAGKVVRIKREMENKKIMKELENG